MYTAKRILIKEDAGDCTVPTLAIDGLRDGISIIIEACPEIFGRQAALGGRSRIYFGTSDSYKIIDEVEVSHRVIEAADTYVSACLALHAQASMFGALGNLAITDTD